MNKNLDYLDKYSSNKRYFHFLFSRIAEYAQKADDSTNYLEKNLNNLKEKYKDQLFFIVWNSKGEKIEKLSDKKGYNFVLNKLFKILKEVNTAVKDDSSVKISNFDSVKNNLNLFRNFLGKIFIPENLKYPLSNSLNAGPFLVEPGQGLSSVWFSINDKISFLCFLSDKLLNNYSGLEKITQNLNKDKSEIISGFTISSNVNKPISPFPKSYENDLSIALAKFENAGENYYENERAIVRMSMPQPDIRTFCFLHKTEDKWNINYKKHLWFGILYSTLLALYCLLGFWFLLKRHFFSIKWKLTALFLFANIAPILILSFITKDYIEGKRTSLKNEIVTDLEKNMRDFDAKSNALQEDYSIKLNYIVDEISKKIGSGTIKEPEKIKLESLFDDFNCSNLYVVASDGEFICVKRNEKIINQRLEFISNMGKSVLAYSNNKVYEEKQKDVFSNILNPQNSEFIRLYLKNLRKVNKIVFGDTDWIYYGYFFGDKSIYNNNYTLMLIWNRELFQNLFVKEYYKSLYNNFPTGNFYIKSNISNISYGPEKYIENVNSIFAQNSEMTEKSSGYVDIEGKRNIFVHLNCTYIKNWTILAIYPEDSINREINILIVQIVLGALASLLLTIIIGHLLSLQFLKPIHHLGEAALAIGERNFSHRVPIGDKDEFGHLNQVFNRVIEGLGDFEVARIVQESLFPGNHFDVGEFNIFGRSIVMTTLGGDYYDCFKINDKYQGIVIGDVAGHGIPAGLMMAMAKSAVLTASEEIKLDPARLTARLHNIFYAIKNNKQKRMMTFQYYVLNVETGHFIYTNAGHCFPVIVDHNTNTAKYIEYISSPLGIIAKCRCKNKEFDLLEGQSLVLYTDGIVEANNENGEQYGYDRYKDCLPINYDVNPEIFYYNLLNKVYRQWSPKPDDDLTLIIVNRK